jgi:hypothetical protein
MHFVLMSTFAAVVAIVLAAIDPDRHDPKARLVHGLKIFGLFLLVGIVIGWVLGSRAARDAYAAELKRREERARPPRA